MAFVPYKKKDKKNDGKDLTRPVPEFKPMPPTKETAPVSGLPLDDTEDGDQGPGLVSKILTLCSLPFLVGAVWAKKAAIASWNGIRWCGARIGHIGYLFVWKSADDEIDETETPKQLPQTPSPDKIKAPTSASSNAVTPLAAVDDPAFEEDEEKFGWLNVGTKLGALAVIGLLLVGVFYGAKTYFASSKKSNARPPDVLTSADPKDISVAAPPVVDHGKPPIANKSSKPVDNVPKKAETPPKKAETPPKNTDSLPEQNVEIPPTIEAPKLEGNPWNSSPVSSTTDLPSMNDWGNTVLPTPATVEPQDLAAPIPAAPAWDAPAPPSPSVPAPPIAATDLLAPVSPASAIAPIPIVPENTSPAVEPLTSPIPTLDVEKPLSIPEPATALKPMTIPSPPATPSSFDVMGDKPEFQIAPVPPNKDATLTPSEINSLPSLNPSPPTPEVVPGIPSSETVEPLIVSAPPPPRVEIEPAPGIPEPITLPESTAVFAVPNLVEPESYSPPPVIPPPPIPPVEPLTAFIPPPLVSSVPTLSPVSSTPPSGETHIEPAIGIPEPIVPTAATTSVIPVTHPVPPPEMQPPTPTVTPILSMNTPTFSQPLVETSEGTAQNDSVPVVAGSVSPLPMPGDPNDPASNPLLNLNPSGMGLVENDGPPARLVTPNPKYQDLQATAAPEASTTYRQRRAINAVPNAKQYIVEPGDTYMTISTRFYDTSLLYRALAVHNRRLGAQWLPEPGTELEIPPQEYLQTNYAEILSRSGERSNLSISGERQAPSSIVTTAPATSVHQGVRYVVREGDTVFKIAEERLRDTGRWRDIVQWNSDQLRDARDLRPGMEITLPVLR